MAAPLIIEEETGTYRPTLRGRHDGYFAGDFSDQPLRLLDYQNGTWRLLSDARRAEWSR